MNIADIRKDYKQQSLLGKGIEKKPLVQFDRWWQDAMHSGIEEVNAMTLATASATGLPAARIVLLKGYDEKGFVFFTNYESYKGMQLEENPARLPGVFLGGTGKAGPYYRTGRKNHRCRKR